MLDWLCPAAPLTVTVGDARLPLAIRRNARARRLTLRMAPDGAEVRVSMPRWGRNADALAFAVAQAPWIARQLAALPVRQAIGPGSAVPYRGDMLMVRHDPALPRRVRRDGATIMLGGPAEGVERRLERWLRAQARALILDDVAHYTARAGLPPATLALSNAQRRWGSCSGTGAIRINWRLVMAPDSVRRSVVAHEVAHLIAFDHSPRFHATLARLYDGDIAAANRWLKAHGRSLYAVL